MEEQEVLDWWQEVLQFREDGFAKFENMTDFTENPYEVGDMFKKFDLVHQRRRTKDEWYAILHKLIEQRWFMGYLSRQEVAAQEKIFIDFHMPQMFFVYLNRAGQIILSVSYGVSDVECTSKAYCHERDWGGCFF